MKRDCPGCSRRSHWKEDNGEQTCGARVAGSAAMQGHACGDLVLRGGRGCGESDGPRGIQDMRCTGVSEEAGLVGGGEAIHPDEAEQGRCRLRHWRVPCGITCTRCLQSAQAADASGQWICSSRARRRGQG